ncbi:hypothetical protein EJ04DRAFT_137970 [Polyplosphaeria fusca]|uniref:Uncharacterized protein n=1 Tax=Polyplosphaeria fusca TaxID=682080 RepID=A0A9P4QME3_9PLEO|nr:hypothetical protein EJ04DRAFT_137970 [Polyplosphaeria fusca]
MTAAHIRIRIALSQALRPSISKAPLAWTVPDFLAPAFARPPTHAFSSTRPRRIIADSSAYTHPIPALHDVSSHKTRRKPHHNDTSRSRAPHSEEAADIQTFVAALDAFLPPHLRQTSAAQSKHSDTATPLSLSSLINAAQDAKHDVLCYMAFQEMRWDAVVWLAKKLVEIGPAVLEPPVSLEPSANVIWPEHAPASMRTLQELTNEPVLTHRVRPSRRLKHSLDELTSAPDSLEHKHRDVKRAIGQLWRSLGSMVLAAASGQKEERDLIMSRALEIVAHLHHVGMIPESVYKHKSPRAGFALEQPPTLPILASQILTALSDATWRAHEASVNSAKETKKAAYFLGYEIPGSRFKAPTTELAPALWLELVLWSCLHGGWVLDGAVVLERLLANHEELEWRLISWREMLEDENAPSPASKFKWRGAAPAEDRATVAKSISSEVVTAFADGLVNLMRVGVGHRGSEPEELLHYLQQLKRLLEINSLSLGSTTWDSIMGRLLEAGGIVPEKRPELLLIMVKLASDFGTEVGSVNAAPRALQADTTLPYFYEPSAVSIGILHRTLRSFLDNGDLAGALASVQALQKYTDDNKQNSMRQFFERLKSVQTPSDEPFTSALAPIDFPGFDPQIPQPLLAKLLDLATESNHLSLARWLMYSKDLDGPLIAEHMYADWKIAASIIRFGSITKKPDLILKMVERSAIKSETKQILPSDITTAILGSQIQLMRWKSVERIQESVVQQGGYRPDAIVLASFAVVLLRLSSAANYFTREQKKEAMAAFTSFLFAWERLILTSLSNELNCILAIMSTVDDEWRHFCLKFLTFSTRQPVNLSTNDFNKILGGVLDGYGSAKGREMVDTWCYSAPASFEPYRAPGGLPTMPRFRVGKGEEYQSWPGDIVVVQETGSRLILQGRVQPNRQTVLSVLHKVQRELDQIREKKRSPDEAKLAEFKQTLNWASRLLYYLGFDYEDVIRDLGSLTELAELEAPPVVKITGAPQA